jgi:hypothetical protein
VTDTVLAVGFPTAEYSKKEKQAMKKIFLAIVFVAIGLTVLPQVQAQTQQQQQELEQIARRSVNGLSPQDRQRTIQIMTDVFVAQGISRQQAASLAEMSADSMFTADIGEMSAEEQRMFEEQNRAIDDFEQRQRQPQQQAQTPQQQQKQPGETVGWPTAAIFSQWGISNLRQPAGVQPSYSNHGADSGLEVFMTGANANTLQELKRQIESALGQQMHFNANGNEYSGTLSGNRFLSKSVLLKLEGNQLQMIFIISAG